MPKVADSALLTVAKSQNRWRNGYRYLHFIVWIIIMVTGRFFGFSQLTLLLLSVIIFLLSALNINAHDLIGLDDLVRMAEAGTLIPERNGIAKWRCIAKSRWKCFNSDV